MGWMTRGSATRRMIVGIAGLTVLAASAGVAGGALKTRSVETTIGSNFEFGSATASCKKGTRAVSGGFDSPGFGPTSVDARTVAFLSQRTAKRKWTAAAEGTGSEPSTLAVAAYCSDTLPRLKVKSKSTTIGEEESAAATASCRKGQEAVSGGFVTKDGPDQDDPYAFESRRIGKRKWRASAFNFGPAPVDVTAIAYCAKEKLGLKTESDQVTNDESNVTVSATAQCKKGTKAVSGGFEGVLEYPASGDHETYPFQSIRSGGRSWSAAAGGYVTDGADVPWTAFAYCLDKKEL
jgi:hypothetical protein